MDKILSYITEHQADAILMRKIQAVLDEHLRLKTAAEQNAQFADRLIAAGVSDPYMVALLKVARESALTYSQDAWVPDEYETLEHRGLVHCTFGPRARSGLSTRTIEPTQAGLSLVQRARELTAA